MRFKVRRRRQRSHSHIYIIIYIYIYLSFDLHPIEPGVQHVYSAHRKLMRFVTTSSNHKQPLETSGNPARTGHVHVQSRTM